MSGKEVNEVWSHWPSLSGTPTGSVELLSECDFDSDATSAQVSWEERSGLPRGVLDIISPQERAMLKEIYSKPIGTYGDFAVQVRCGRCAGCKATKAGLVTKCANQYQSTMANYTSEQVSQVPKRCPRCDAYGSLTPSAWIPNTLYCMMCPWTDPGYFLPKKSAAKPASTSTTAKSQPSKVCKHSWAPRRQPIGPTFHGECIYCHETKCCCFFL